jgi:hypothetical protein
LGIPSTVAMLLLHVITPKHKWDSLKLKGNYLKNRVAKLIDKAILEKLNIGPLNKNMLKRSLPKNSILVP